jgi:hypothetical protein
LFEVPCANDFEAEQASRTKIISNIPALCFKIVLIALKIVTKKNTALKFK